MKAVKRISNNAFSFHGVRTRRNIVLNGKARHPDPSKGEFVVNFFGNGDYDLPRLKFERTPIVTFLNC